MSLLLKNSPKVASLSLYDIAHTPGVAADLSHIETRAKVSGHLGPESLEACLTGSDVVLIPAGVPRKPGLLFINEFTGITNQYHVSIVTVLQNTNFNILLKKILKCIAIISSHSPLFIFMYIL